MADPTYRIVDLGPLGFTADPDQIGTFDINDHNQVAYGLENASGVVRPTVWLPASAYGFSVPFEGGTIDLIEEFDIEGWTTGIAFDINDDGIVVGQLGGFARNVPGSRAAWWNLNTMTWGTIDPQAPAGGLLAEPWQDWTRAIAVSEGTAPQILVETWDEDPCPSGCGFQSGTTAGLVGTATAPIGATGISVLLQPLPGDCHPASLGRDIRIAPGGTQVVGSNGLVSIRDSCINPLIDPCEAFTIGYSWLDGAQSVLVDFDGPPFEYGSQARGVASDGVFVGWAFDEQPEVDPCYRRPVLWNGPATTPEILTSPGPSLGDQFRAEGVTGPRAGGRLAVGWNSFAESAVRWQEAGSSGWSFTDLESVNVIDLGTCSATSGLTFAFDVSEHDWIVAAGRNSVGTPDPWHIYILVPLAPSGCIGDIDGDNLVGLTDLLAVLGAWGGCTPCGICSTDLNGDNAIGIGDLLVILSAWGDCAGGSWTPPQTVADCFQKFGSDPIALEACLLAIGATP